MVIASGWICGGGNVAFVSDFTNQEKLLSLFSRSKFLTVACVENGRQLNLEGARANLYPQEKTRQRGGFIRWTNEGHTSPRLSSTPRWTFIASTSADVAFLVNCSG